MLGDEPPYTGPTAMAIAAKRLLEPVPKIRTLRETVPEHVAAALNRATERKCREAVRLTRQAQLTHRRTHFYDGTHNHMTPGENFSEHERRRQRTYRSNA